MSLMMTTLVYLVDSMFGIGVESIAVVLDVELTMHHREEPPHPTSPFAAAVVVVVVVDQTCKTQEPPLDPLD